MNTLPDNPRISIIILTEHLRKGHGTPPDFNITVWDNGSQDDTAAAIREADPAATVLISEKNLGVAGGRNAAAKAVIAKDDPDFLLFLDNDMTVCPGFVGALAAPFYGENGAAIGQTQAKLRLSRASE
jgi:GT2 family glycosyltransferase